MSPGVGILLMMNNYFHDVATALLLASGVAMWIIVQKLGDENDVSVVAYFLRIYKGVTRLAKFSLIWILVGGIPRTLSYQQFEWSNAAGKGQIAALIIKHILAFIFVGAGAHIWMKINRKIKKLEAQAQTVQTVRSSG